MEEYYNTLADVLFQKDYCAWLGPGVEEDILHPEVVLFEMTLCGELYDDQLEQLLGYVAERGYRIIMNFHAPDVVLGNVAVKIHEKWFAFGECINQSTRESQEGEYVTEIWPLKQVILNLQQMEVKPRCVFPIRPTHCFAVNKIL
jgi:transcription initiation factor IIE alpha subunit